ncbi:MAG: hypothetical protein IKW33_02440 [Clostridia bacterium]|nr:hypothetical protein [Clostridia bacterium]
MDSKITKKRLYNFLEYDWIAIIASIIGAIILFSVLFSFFSVKLTPGQYFKYFYDNGVASENDTAFYSMLKDNNTFSYDVLELKSERLIGDNQILPARLSIQEGDAIISSLKVDEEQEYSPAYKVIKNQYYFVYDFDTILVDAINYLKTFIADQTEKEKISVETLESLTYDALSKELIDNNFLTRMAKDNRFRSQAQKEEGKLLERARIEKLVNEVKNFKKIIVYNENQTEENKIFYKPTVKVDDTEKTANFGLKLEKLPYENSEKKANHHVSEFFRLSGESTAKDTVLILFNFVKQQPNLQFESISFVNEIVRQCSNILG